MPTALAPGDSPPIRDRLKAIALRCFAERGYHAVGLRQIASELGLQAGSLYAHIQNKESLLRELIEDGYDDLIESARHALYECRGRGSALATFIRHHLDYQVVHASWYFLATIEVRHLPREQCDDIIELQRQYAALLQGALPEGGRRHANPKGLTEQILGLLNGTPQLKSRWQQVRKLDGWEADIERLILGRFE